MPDEITATHDSGGTFTPHPEGQFAAICVDTINLGERVEQFPGQPQRAKKKIALVFQTDECDPTTGTPLTIASEVTLSLGEKASLRRFLESWRGRAYTEDEIDAGVPLHKLVGQPALIAVEHKRSQSGRLYGKINTIMKLPKGMTAPTVDYTRADYWAERKAEYAAGVAAFHAASASANDVPLDTEEGEDGLPF